MVTKENIIRMICVVFLICSTIYLAPKFEGYIFIWALWGLAIFIGSIVEEPKDKIQPKKEEKKI